MSEQSFSTEQQEYLKGFMSGVETRRGALGLPLAPVGDAAPADPSDLQRAAQDRILAAGGKLVPQEEAKREKHPLDRFGDISAMAGEGKFAKGLDDFLIRFHGLFYVGPTQDAYMCRLRIPGGILSANQFRGVADIADQLGGGFADVTTRANLQIRQIAAANAPEMLLRLTELGLTSQGSGADNVRNVTGSPTAGIDPQELVDTRLHARAIHHHILRHRELYGLPRKFNIAFDGGGRVLVLEETNDIAFTAVRVADGFGAEPGVYYRLALGGITGHCDLARETGVIVPLDQTTKVCDAILRVFIGNGDRTDRGKARLKYLLDRWGVAKFLGEVERELGSKLIRVDSAAILARPEQDKRGHVGVHGQRQPGLNYIGIVCPVGRLTTERMRGLADIADRYGSGTIRLTVWQNLLISDIPDGKVEAVLDEVQALGLATKASRLRGGLVACTGNAGCKFAASNTKSHAAQLADWLDARITLAAPVNIHLTGCHHSCAQHYIADIGLLGAKVERGDDMIEGYDLHVGGGAGADQKIGRLIKPKVAFDELPPMVLSLLSDWMDRAPDESFQSHTTKMTDDELAALCGRVLAEA
jgi:ferredoxin-nitrite reductase